MKSKKIVITGGSRGIGKAMVDLFLKDNCEVHVIARNFENIPKNPKLFFHSLDLIKTREIFQFCEGFISNYGVPDLLINNAGTGAFFEWDSFPKDQITKQIDLLFVSPVLMCRAFAPEMTLRKKGKIVNISSLAVLYPVPFMPLYNACKSALSSFTCSLQLEFDSNPVFIDVVLGDVKTEFNDRLIRNTADFWSTRTKSAWLQVEKQLHDSPEPNLIAKRLVSKIYKCNGGIIYEGGFFHRMIYTLAVRFLPHFLKNKILQRRYYS